MSEFNTGSFAVLLILFSFQTGCSAGSAEQDHGKIEISHIIAASEKDKFLGWPANNGTWQWGEEILLGFTRGDYHQGGGHNISGIEESLFSRSMDGGKSWEMFAPENFMDGDNIKWVPEKKNKLATPLDFYHEGFAIRFFATGYHGNDDPDGGFYYSYDRGRSWEGPFYLGNMHNHPELKGFKITTRTDYIVTGENELYVFISARNDHVNRLGCIRTTDGGISFEFLSWITPPHYDIYVNAIMSSTVRLGEDKFITAYRKIYPALNNREGNGVEVAVSDDRGLSWKIISIVKNFESSSNPPALAELKDGRLVCIYGDRHNSRMAGKYSADGGKTWGEEFILRDNFTDGTSYWDFGYPVLFSGNDGKLLAAYYWASEENMQQHIAVSAWYPPEFEPELSSK
jgi:hypothetical protein